MNDAQVRAVPVFNGWEGHFTKIDTSGWHKVEVNGIAQLYGSELEAKVAAYEAMMRHIFGKGIVRDGERASGAKSQAEAMFSKIFPGKGRRPVEVVRR